MARQPIVSKLSTAKLFKISSTGAIDTSDYNALFLINPESYEDTKSSTGWVGNAIPGQSLPVYQWVAGGPRIISFDALVTNDTSYFNNASGKTQGNLLNSAISKGLSAVGSIASNFLGVPLPAGQIIGALLANDPNDGRFALSISETLEYYRSLYAPTYGSNTVVQSPPLLYFYSGIDNGMFEVPDQIDQTTEVFILTNLSIRVTKQLENLAPMEAIVSFQLEQYPITSIGLSTVTKPGISTGTFGTTDIVTIA